MSAKFGRALAWTWTGFAGIGAMGFATQGHSGASALTFVSAIAACPLVFDKLSASNFSVPRTIRWVVGIAALIGAGSQLPKPAAAPMTEATKTAPTDSTVAMWADFDETWAVSQCDQLVTATAVNRGSVDTAWRWSVARNNEKGEATIERDFDAQNAMGGTISSRYRCVVDRTGRRVISLSIRELSGWRKLI
jgi:hypothetical protein